ncbi:hypothetical protein EVAR_93934_1 [Eumeta japonica]|uniref:Uncharacterized protein n=1 Tax=Eumeta variegata TaxID=151549 RepID=A0A4C1TP52_EUMVA|nr:hypothetical protein EVAR_93934_1 [Eumeta japonica]
MSFHKKLMLHVFASVLSYEIFKLRVIQNGSMTIGIRKIAQSHFDGPAGLREDFHASYSTYIYIYEAQRPQVGEGGGSERRSLNTMTIIERPNDCGDGHSFPYHVLRRPSKSDKILKQEVIGVRGPVVPNNITPEEKSRN